jgi:hypothetical protein
LENERLMAAQKFAAEAIFGRGIMQIPGTTG